MFLNFMLVEFIEKMKWAEDERWLRGGEGTGFKQELMICVWYSNSHWRSEFDVMR